VLSWVLRWVACASRENFLRVSGESGRVSKEGMLRCSNKESVCVVPMAWQLVCVSDESIGGLPRRVASSVWQLAACVSISSAWASASLWVRTPVCVCMYVCIHTSVCVCMSCVSN